MAVTVAVPIWGKYCRLGTPGHTALGKRERRHVGWGVGHVSPRALASRLSSVWTAHRQVTWRHHPPDK